MNADEKSKVLSEVVEPLRTMLGGLSKDARRLLAEEFAKLLPDHLEPKTHAAEEAKR